MAWSSQFDICFALELETVESEGSEARLQSIGSIGNLLCLAMAWSSQVEVCFALELETGESEGSEARLQSIGSIGNLLFSVSAVVLCAILSQMISNIAGLLCIRDHKNDEKLFSLALLTTKTTKY